MYEKEEDRGSEDRPRPGQDQSPDGEAAAADQLERKKAKKKKKKKTKGGQRQDRTNSGLSRSADEPIQHDFTARFDDGHGTEARSTAWGFSVPSSGELFHRRTSWPSGFSRWQMSESPEVLKWAGRPDARRAKGGGADRVQDVVVQSMESCWMWCSSSSRAGRSADWVPCVVLEYARPGVARSPVESRSWRLERLEMGEDGAGNMKVKVWLALALDRDCRARQAPPRSQTARGQVPETTACKLINYRDPVRSHQKQFQRGNGENYPSEPGQPAAIPVLSAVVPQAFKVRPPLLYLTCLVDAAAAEGGRHGAVEKPRHGGRAKAKQGPALFAKLIAQHEIGRCVRRESNEKLERLTSHELLQPLDPRRSVEPLSVFADWTQHVPRGSRTLLYMYLILPFLLALHIVLPRSITRLISNHSSQQSRQLEAPPPVLAIATLLEPQPPAETRYYGRQVNRFQGPPSSVPACRYWGTGDYKQHA
ncbi:hypothetical protein CCMA1212_005635 [Trichoderma ghanense]|uniref:Uncharacterized protein n=1 Tax=Trichoderma ghanense TaxID=65468 RepID=A0ABY2H227_9HYPO